MQNRWALPCRASVMKPSSPASGDSLLPPPYPPDPPDPATTLSPVQFPPLSATPPKSRSELRRSLISSPPTDTVMVHANSPTSTVEASSLTTQTLPSESVTTEIGSENTAPVTVNPIYASSAVTVTLSTPDSEIIESTFTPFKILPLEITPLS